MSIGGRRGFTLVEALVSVALAGIGVVASVGALSTLTKVQARSMEKEVMVRYAVEKFDELSALGNLTSQGGTFEEQGEDRFIWEAEVETTGIENVSQLTVTVSLNDSFNREASESVTGAVYEEPLETEVTP